VSRNVPLDLAPNPEKYKTEKQVSFVAVPLKNALVIPQKQLMKYRTKNMFF
jgi:hypothetical protein